MYSGEEPVQPKTNKQMKFLKIHRIIMRKYQVSDLASPKMLVCERHRKAQGQMDFLVVQWLRIHLPMQLTQV